MDAARWQRVKATLADTLDRPPAERDAFLLDACAGQTTVRREVESLLVQTTGGLEECANALATPADGELDPNVGRRVGAWVLGTRLGAGGMGAVYLARRADGAFAQTAAVKLIRRGTDTEEVLRRFRAERQILARLEHPHIARLLDGGATDDGLPFFVLEHVEGQPVTVFARGLPVADRLRLFIKICGAVLHAHQNLVIHRDLKPANILVTAEGEPKLLDFGIAKLLQVGDEPLPDLTLPLDGPGRLTPAYASPEQVRGDPVTTASDVYTLGALLFEMLAGYPAHRFSSPRPSPTEMARVICEHLPPRPSLAAYDADVRRRLRGDLDNIVLKALEKVPDRRYLTVNALAEDVRRHLNGRPVHARPATAGYVLRRFVARNRLPVAAGVLLSLALLGGAAGTLWQARRAERRFNDVRRLAHSLLFEVDDALERGPTAARQFLVRRALENLDDLADESRGDLGLQRDLATAYRKVGDVQSRLHVANLGDTAGAIISYRKALALREALVLGGNHPGDARALAGDHGRLGDMLSKTGDTAGALASYRRAVALLKTHLAPAADREARREVGQMHDRLGCTLLRTGDTAGAEREMLAGRDERLALAETAPGDVEAQLDLGRSDASLAYLLGTVGRPEEALARFRRTAATATRLLKANPANLSIQRMCLDSHGAVGIGLTACGDAPGALRELRVALALAEEALTRDPENMQAHNDLADVLHETGDAFLLGADPTGAAAYQRRALEHYRAVAGADPVNVHARRQVALVEHELARALGAGGDAPGAVVGLRAVLPEFEALAVRDPANVGFGRDLARCLADLGHWLGVLGEETAGTAAAHRALTLYEVLARRTPADTHVAAELAALRTWPGGRSGRPGAGPLD